MFLLRTSILAMAATGLLDLTAAAAISPAIERETQFTYLSARRDCTAPFPLAKMFADSAAEHLKQRQSQTAVHRCYKPSPTNDPTPSSEDCKGCITKLQAVQGDITVKLVEGCYETWNGNCTASVCPQKDGTSVISPSTAAQFMIDSVMTECISNGLRGWYLDRSYGIGVYLT
ncbi:hypothetical protein F4781DRAFT_435187 [Annulohypoxylon bovei var. microspora]|nr:hypothetical protein F4781DRAFT_435187 [Annulohypoxylon bovei var. microspora]